jgi:hypothetical protein
MRAGGIKSPTTLGVDPVSRRNDAAPGLPEPAAGSAVIPLTPTATAKPVSLSARRPTAPFLAHLIATHDGLPQTRARRRVEPAVAANLYGAAAGVTARRSLGGTLTKLM